MHPIYYSLFVCFKPHFSEIWLRERVEIPIFENENEELQLSRAISKNS
jgi:hypothetical protein